MATVTRHRGHAISIDPKFGTDTGDRSFWAEKITGSKGKGKKKRVKVEKYDLESKITQITITDTIMGASTIEIMVEDENWKLINDGFFDADKDGRFDKIDVNYPDGSRFWWRLCQVGVAGDRGGAQVTMTFMERAALHLMLRKGPKKAKRGKITRAEFIKSLCDEVGKRSTVPAIKFHSKELHWLQQIEGQGEFVGHVAGKIYSVGDSLAVGTEAPLNELVPGRIATTKADVGQPSSWGVDVLQAASSLPNTLLIQLGTNDSDLSTFRANVRTIRNMSVKRIYWVNIAKPAAGGATDEQLNNVLTEEAALSGDKLKIINWKAQVAAGKVDLSSDSMHIHPTAAGYAKRAQIIANAIGTPHQPNPRETSPQERDENKDQGFARDTVLEGNQGPITGDRVRRAEIMLDVAMQLNAPDEAVIALVIAGMIEAPDFANPEYGGLNNAYSGVLQYNQGVGHENAMDPAWVTRHFLTQGATGAGGKGAIGWAKTGMSAPEIINTIHNPGGQQFYEGDDLRSKAEKIIEQYGGTSGSGSGGGGSRSYTKAYHFRVNRRENYWDAITRLATEVNWRFFLDGQHAYYDDEMRFVVQRPVATIKRRDPAVVSFNSNWDQRKVSTEASLELICNPFEYRAGQVLILEGFGPASTGSTAEPSGLPGRWLIEEIRRDRFDLVSSFTLKQPERPKPEPAPEVGTRSGNDPSAADTENLGGGVGLAAGVDPSAVSTSGGGAWGAGRDYGGHAGVDISMPEGTKLIACVDGTVACVDYGWYGSSNGRGQGLVSIKSSEQSGGFPKGTIFGYGHPDTIYVDQGDQVKAGDVLALSGSPGGGAHLHFFIHTGGQACGNGNTDPTAYAKASLGGQFAADEPVRPQTGTPVG